MQNTALLTHFKAASEKQVAFIQRLIADKDHSYLDYEFKTMDFSAVSITEASRIIEDLLDCPRKSSEEPQHLTPGIYKHDGTVYVVKPNKEGSNLYAKKLVEISGRRLTEAGSIVEIEFHYAPGVIRKIRPSEKMSLEEGKALTIRYGRCICCGRKLKDAKSVEQGIGPVCRKLFTSF